LNTMRVVVLLQSFSLMGAVVPPSTRIKFDVTGRSGSSAGSLDERPDVELDPSRRGNDRTHQAE
jgi:hypothetical protein